MGYILLVLAFVGVYKLLTYKDKGPTDDSGSGLSLF